MLDVLTSTLLKSFMIEHDKTNECIFFSEITVLRTESFMIGGKSLDGKQRRKTTLRWEAERIINY